VTSWLKLEKSEYAEVWDKFYQQFKFKPSVDEKDWPGIREPSASVTYDISNFWKDFTEEKYYDLHQKALQVFQNCTKTDEVMYALDWQHECYKFNPHLPLDTVPYKPHESASMLNQWLIQIIPDGDYSIFLTKDFKNGLFGHPWQQTICVFGNCFLQSFEKFKPIVFNEIKRRKP